MACSSSTCPHPVGPIILHALGIGGIVVVVVLVGLVVWLRLRSGTSKGGWPGGGRMGR